MKFLLVAAIWWSGAAAEVKAADTPSASKQSAPSRLAYTHLTNTYWQIWVQELGGESRQLTSSAFDKRSPAWSADGTQLVYRSNNRELYRYDVKAQREERLCPQLGNMADPVWMPDGRHLLVTRFDATLKDESAIWLIDLSGSQRTVLTHTPGLEYAADVSPDSTTMVYIGGKGAGNHELYRMDMATQRVVRLTDNRALEQSPKFSPDGTRIAFAADASGNFEIYTMARDGGHVQQLTTWEGMNVSPVWSPDGSRFLFVSDRGGVLQLWMMDADGGQVRRVEGAPDVVQEPSWR